MFSLSIKRINHIYDIQLGFESQSDLSSLLSMF